MYLNIKDYTKNNLYFTQIIIPLVKNILLVEALSEYSEDEIRSMDQQISEKLFEKFMSHKVLIVVAGTDGNDDLMQTELSESHAMNRVYLSGGWTAQAQLDYELLMSDVGDANKQSVYYSHVAFGII